MCRTGCLCFECCPPVVSINDPCFTMKVADEKRPKYYTARSANGRPAILRTETDNDESCVDESPPPANDSYPSPRCARKQAHPTNESGDDLCDDFTDLDITGVSPRPRPFSRHCSADFTRVTSLDAFTNRRAIASDLLQTCDTCRPEYIGDRGVGGGGGGTDLCTTCNGFNCNRVSSSSCCSPSPRSKRIVCSGTVRSSSSSKPATTRRIIRTKRMQKKKKKKLTSVTRGVPPPPPCTRGEDICGSCFDVACTPPCTQCCPADTTPLARGVDLPPPPGVRYARTHAVRYCEPPPLRCTEAPIHCHRQREVLKASRCRSLSPRKWNSSPYWLHPKYLRSLLPPLVTPLVFVYVSLSKLYSVYVTVINRLYPIPYMWIVDVTFNL